MAAGGDDWIGRGIPPRFRQTVAPFPIGSDAMALYLSAGGARCPVCGERMVCSEKTPNVWVCWRTNRCGPLTTEAVVRSTRDRADRQIERLNAAGCEQAKRSGGGR